MSNVRSSPIKERTFLFTIGLVNFVQNIININFPAQTTPGQRGTASRSTGLAQ